MKHSLLILFMLATFGSCGKQEKQETDLKTFDVRGEVVSIDHARKRIFIDHEEIPDYMAAMTMPFKVKDTTFLGLVQVGDTVQGTLAVSRTESWLAAVTVVGKGTPPSSDEVKDAIFQKLFKAGEPLPNVHLRNQEGKTVSFSTYRGKVVALTFIYSRCPLPDFCILMSNNFSKVQHALKIERDLNGSWQLLTISFDTKFDTPKVLKEYGTNYGADFSNWDFVVGTDEVTRELARGFDMYIETGAGGLIDHNLRTAILDPDGKLVKVIKGNEWKADDIVAEVKKHSRRQAS